MLHSVTESAELDPGVLGQYYTIKPASISADSVTKCSIYQWTEEVLSMGRLHEKRDHSNFCVVHLVLTPCIKLITIHGWKLHHLLKNWMGVHLTWNYVGFWCYSGSLLSSKVAKGWFFHFPLLDFNYYNIESFVHLTEKLVLTKVSTFMHIAKNPVFKKCSKCLYFSSKLKKWL